MVFEIKPKALWNLPIIRAKFYAAKKHFIPLGFKYVLAHFKIECSTIKEAYLRGDVEFFNLEKAKKSISARFGYKL